MAKLLNMTMAEIIKSCGMRSILEGLIAELNTDEDYIRQLKTDLETALKNYEKRHDKP